MATPSLLQRLQERKLVQWALAYLAGAWALVEATNLVLEQFHWPDVFGQVITVLAFFGFFVVLVLAWYHGEKGYQKLTGSELLILTVILVVAGTSVAGVRRSAVSAAAVAPDGLWGLARFAAVDSDRPAIAVLPLANLSAKEENAYFAAGIHEELLRQLSLVRSLAVISRTSVLPYAGSNRSVGDIAAEIGARYVVEGSVQEDEGRVRVQVQLIDAASDSHIWAERYDRTFDDLLELQSELAESIAGALETAVTPDEQRRIQTRPTDNPIAYDLYLQAGALNAQRKNDYDTVVELLRRATRMDPRFALAHLRLAVNYWNGTSYHGYPPRDSMLARAKLAVEADPDLPDAHGWRAVLLASVHQDDSARVEIERALELDPSNGAAWTALTVTAEWSGDHVGAALAGRQAARVDPRGMTAQHHMALSLTNMGMYEEASRWFERLLEMAPNDMWVLSGLWSISLRRNDMEAARGYAAAIRSAGNDNPLALYFSATQDIMESQLEAAETTLKHLVQYDPGLSTYGSPTPEALLGAVMARSGNPEGAERLQQLRDRRMKEVDGGSTSRTARSDLMVAAAIVGDEQELAHWFVEATRMDRWGFWPMCRNAPFLDPIRDRPEFQEWLRETDARMAAQRRELAAMGSWTPEAVLGNAAGGT